MSNKNNNIGRTGIGSPTGTTGHHGTAGPAGYSIMNIIEDIISKYGNRFILKDYKVNNNTMLPSYIITDNFTLKEHQFVANSMINLDKDFQSFIQNIIISERDKKIDNIING